jgi:hypothetical protein
LSLIVLFCWILNPSAALVINLDTLSLDASVNYLLTVFVNGFIEMSFFIIYNKKIY